VNRTDKGHAGFAQEAHSGQVLKGKMCDWAFGLSNSGDLVEGQWKEAEPRTWGDDQRPQATGPRRVGLVKSAD